MVKKGYITMATGDDSYFRLAHNLLLSYRLFSKVPLPFAIVSDRENEWTKDFDEVVIMEGCQGSFFDKLRLPYVLPFEENIFIDADCLAYRDLNGLWKLFNNTGCFSVLGKSFALGSGGWWGSRSDLGRYGNNVDFSMCFQGGLIYMRKGSELNSFNRTCSDILSSLQELEFPFYPSADPTEEPVFALAAAVHGLRPTEVWYNVFCYRPHCREFFYTDISKGQIRYRYDYKLGWLDKHFPLGRYFVHWSTEDTKTDAYREEEYRLLTMVNSGCRPAFYQETVNSSRDQLILGLRFLRDIRRKVISFGRSLIH